MAIAIAPAIPLRRSSPCFTPQRTGRRRAIAAIVLHPFGKTGGAKVLLVCCHLGGCTVCESKEGQSTQQVSMHCQ
jgi:hypothetical protein